MYSSDKRFWSVLIIITVLFFVSMPLLSQRAVAGELIRSPRRIQQSQGNMRGRIIRPSTAAVRAIERYRGSKQVNTLKTTSPYDYRIVEFENAQDKYEAQLAKWEQKVVKQQTRERQRLEKLAEKESIRKEKERKRERDRLARAQRVDRKSSLRNILSRSEKSNVLEDTQGRAKKSDAFFATSSAPATRAEARTKLSFWQRLKRAFFGGS